jgi:hypothetical protein
VERGIKLAKQAPHTSMAESELSKLNRVLLVKLGRGDEALHDAWAEYRKHSDKYTYADVMKHVPKAERAAWHEKAMEAATGSGLDSLIELFLETKELERLADLLRRSGSEALEGLSHFTTQPAAKGLEKTHPNVAARLWCAQGMRIVDAKKSKYYAAALSNFERARRGFERAGLVDEWQRIVRKVRLDHHRKGASWPGSRKSSRLRTEPKAVVPAASEKHAGRESVDGDPDAGARRREQVTQLAVSAWANSRERMRCPRALLCRWSTDRSRRWKEAPRRRRHGAPGVRRYQHGGFRGRVPRHPPAITRPLGPRPYR